MNIDFKINGITLFTDRLYLRAFKYTDLDDFYNYASVEGVGEMAGWAHHQNKIESKEILDMFIKEDKVFAIVDKKSNKVIGSLGVEKYNESALKEFDLYKCRELGFVLSKDYWGHGLMKEAIITVMNYLFEVYDLDIIVCGHFTTNAQSKRVQEKCGFKPYRKISYTTRMNTKKEMVVNVIISFKKALTYEALPYKEII